MVKKLKSTVHTARTIMFEELSRVINSTIDDNKYIDSLNDNIAGKQTKTNQKRTNSALLSLYKLDINYTPFLCFKYFWQMADEKELPIITLLYAICNDYLLNESTDVILSTPIGEKVEKLKLEENIELFNPNKYTPKTKGSSTRNLISSWKQAGYISNDKLCTRKEQNHTYRTVAFAFLMAYLSGERGDFILSSKWVKTLALNDSRIREFASEASKRDLLKYQYAGNVSVISFDNLFKRLNINV